MCVRLRAPLAISDSCFALAGLSMLCACMLRASYALPVAVTCIALHPFQSTRRHPPPAPGSWLLLLVLASGPGFWSWLLVLVLVLVLVLLSQSNTPS
jgi:hypothetical protein